MSRIDNENMNAIRTPMEVKISLQGAFSTDSDIRVDGGSIGYIYDTISVEHQGWRVRKLTDLAGDADGEGYPLDGSCELYDSTMEASAENGKAGFLVPTEWLGTPPSITLSARQGVGAITLKTRGEGMLYDRLADRYIEIKPYMVIPVTTIGSYLLQLYPEAGQRLAIEWIGEGIALDFDNSNLISCDMTLRSALDIANPKWKTSELTFKAHCPSGLESVVGNLSAESPITYTAGYPGDMCQDRQFYLSGQAKIEDNVITLTALDASSRLNNNHNGYFYTFSQQTRQTNAYNIIKKMISDAGINLVNVQSAPGNVPGVSTTKRNLFIKPGAYNKHIAFTMYALREFENAFHPKFVDGGIPTLTWSASQPKLTIYEAECGSVTDNYEQNLRSIDGVFNHTTTSKETIIKSVEVEKNEEYTIALGASFKDKHIKIAGSSANVKMLSSTYSEVRFIAKKTGTCLIYGTPIILNNDFVRTYSQARAGKDLKVDYAYNEVWLVNQDEYAYSILSPSNHTGSFKWKGDPRLQARDAFIFHRLDGTEIDCTISQIHLTHDKGGTVCTIEFREGLY